MKKVGLAFLSFLLVALIMINPVNAESNTDSDNSSIEAIQQNLLVYLQSLNIKTKEEAENGIATYFNENPINEDIVAAYYAKQNKKTSLPEYEGTTNPDQDFIAYMEENIEKNNFNEHEISNGVKIIFTNSPVYFIESSENDQSNVLQDSNIRVNALAKASKQTDIKTWTYEGNNILGMKLFEVGVKGYFTYNGANSNGHLVDAWYNKGLASTWQVSNWDKGVRSVGNGKSRVYASGNFHWGAEIKGYGFTIQDVYVNLYLEGDKNGGILYNKEVH
ncbi:hypothetical protein SK066_18390 [Paenibacillus hunanensis]|uniref:hypothetical protein n=1 Tax=Paenibacillus hunanensis TaxID=539262 RepID=UPI002A6AD7D2|nr:hypothetical protein [Paenibacillus hunanensis]WPP40545.1 hypothetical protein SK066_18390 [Paenibacillus hunanensis]